MMRIGIISGVLGLCFALAVHAQKSDSIKSVSLSEVVVTESYQQHQMKKTALTVDVANKDFLRKNFTGYGQYSWRTGDGHRCRYL